MGTTKEEKIEFEKDNLYCYTPLPQYGEDIYKKELVMTKEAFIECYSRWIKGNLDENMSEQERWLKGM